MDAEAVAERADGTDEEREAKSKRRKVELSPEQKAEKDRKNAVDRFEALCAAWKWFNSTLAARTRYLLDGMASCALCSATFMVGTNTGNVAKHATTQKHIAKEKEALGPGVNAYFSAERPVRTLSQTERNKKTELTNHLRALTHASIAGHGMPPSQIAGILGKGSLIYKAQQLLDKEGVGLGAAGTIAADLPTAERLLEARLAKKVAHTYGCISQDGATFGDSHVLVLCYDSPQLGGSYLLGLIFPEEDDDYDVGDPRRYKYSAERAAQDCKRIIFDRLKMDPRQIVCAAGDNASFCVAFARCMGLVHGKDVAHGLALTVKQPMRKLQLVEPLVISLSAVLRAGGGKKRIHEINEFALNADMLKAYPNRFATMVTAAVYIETNFEQIKEWTNKSAFMPHGAGAAPAAAALAAAALDDEDDDDDAEEEKKKAGAQAVSVVKAFNEKLALPALRMVGTLFGEVPDLVKAASADSGSVPTDICEKLQAYRDTLKEGEVNPKSVIGPALRGGIMVTQTQMAAMAANVKEVAAQAGAMFDKHVGVTISAMRYKLRYDPRHTPQEYPLEEDADGKLFLGCQEHDFGPALIVQYKAYVAHITAMQHADEDLPEDEKKMCKIKPAKFWENKRTTWPKLADIALWHTAFPIGAIVCERVIARLRPQAAAVRLSAKDDTVSRILRFTVNSELLDEELQATINALAALQ
jgi:hypothetical protein